ncbi:hypothetical protein [Methylocystis parvus]|uniref:Cysteine rich repeat-containing protein n=1 Tax=Methylocystis parvus TaxID=134 RepID=A0A6B8MF38_9HYPH|nr:hypothetical protein [Methylocystis parvus]QGM99290.1 hypothetical protein F7D14_18595 [Methylocystis parvus]WBK00321.1 hypothetical protein MMG94_00935 [Methylocystis parvus OBBP]
MRYLFSIPMLFVILAAAPAHAQGTDAQRAACERDAERLCSSAIPDVIAVENCLRGNVKSLSPACRKQFKGKGR